MHGRSAALAALIGVAAAGCGGSSGAARDAVNITVSRGSCAPGWTAHHGGEYTFAVANHAGADVRVALEQPLSGIVLAQTRSSAGTTGAQLTARLDAGGAYRFICTTSDHRTLGSASVQIPGGAGTPVSLQTSPQPAVVNLLGPLALYSAHTETLLARLRAQLAALEAATAGGALPAARSDWLTAHATWLDLGQDDGAYGAFGTLGGAIDGTTAGLVGGASSAHFTGFHRVELDLWGGEAARAAGDTRTLAALVAQLTPATVAADLPPTVLGLDSWVLRCHEILEDALRDSLSGQDDYGSHSALASIRADVSATREMLDVLSPLLAPRRPGLLPTAHAQLAAIDRAVAAVPGDGSPPITALPLRTRQQIDASVDAALATLAPVSELMQVGAS